MIKFEELINLNFEKRFLILKIQLKVSNFTHINEQNQPKMVNVSDKKITKRTAIAKATMFLGKEIIRNFNNDELLTKKGPVFQTAIIAGIQGVKKTSDLIPMCHPLLINGVDIDINIKIVRANMIWQYSRLSPKQI